ncbi:MAG: ferritin [Acidobacteria bacterium]|nr:ferritin [Acidobacteriota bacterium]
MLSKTIEQALNEQVTVEFQNNRLYLAMSAYFQSMNLTGFAAYMRAQAEEENGHAVRLIDYIQDRGARVSIGALEAPPFSWDSPLAAIEDAYKHEQNNTERINQIIARSHKESDFATTLSLQNLVTEQVKDEATAHEILEKMKLLASAPSGLYLMDREMWQRAQRA